MAHMSFTGRLLVATPLIGDPHFERTVVLLLAHSEAGAYGVVLNRPTEVPVAEVAPEWAGLVSAPGVVFVGGPVDPGATIGLALAGPRAAAELRADGVDVVILTPV